MLNDYTHHLWAPNGYGSAFVTPAYFWGNYGGSYPYYPRTVVSTDLRDYLPFWGAAGGGCCHATQTGTDGATWGQAYTLDVALTTDGSWAGTASGGAYLASGITSLGAVSVGAGGTLEVSASASVCEFSDGLVVSFWGHLALPNPPCTHAPTTVPTESPTETPTGQPFATTGAA